MREEEKGKYIHRPLRLSGKFNQVEIRNQT